jgi:hypothetical protein
MIAENMKPFGFIRIHRPVLVNASFEAVQGLIHCLPGAQIEKVDRCPNSGF